MKKEIGNGTAYLGDCLEVMDQLITQGVKVDAIITDPPYGTTACKRDAVIPFDKMWDRLHKINKGNGAIVLFGSEPFSSALRMSNIKNYKYDWIWEKEQGTNQFLVKKMPLKKHENISVFYKKAPLYNPQMSEGKKIITLRDKNGCFDPITNTELKPTEYDNKGLRYPTTILKFQRDLKNRSHPTQKPVALMEYLIKTYTNEGELVLDFTAGSFSTCVGAENTNRKWIGIEKDEQYFNIGCERILNNKSLAKK